MRSMDLVIQLGLCGMDLDIEYRLYSLGLDRDHGM